MSQAGKNSSQNFTPAEHAEKIRDTAGDKALDQPGACT